MAETPAPSLPAPPPPPPPTGSDPDYWCYQCETRVAVETLPDLPDLICNNCKCGFVESVPSRASSDQIDDPTFGNQFIQVLRLIAEAAREGDAPPPPPPDDLADHPSDDDYLRVELEGWGNNNDGEDEDHDDDDDDDDVEEEEEEEEERNELEVRNGEIRGNNDDEGGDDDDDEGGDDDDDDDDVNVDEDEEDDEEDLRRRRRDVLRLRLRDFAARAANRRNRILDWAEILMGLEDHSIELRLQVPDHVDGGGYIGNPGDYVDEAGYEALLQALAESDGSGRRGAPPASKCAIEGLDTLVIKEEKDVMACAICKDVVNVGEMAKNLPCGHGYHDDCIVQWLGSRNSCPVCRFELPTDDPEYEEERKKRGACVTSRGSSSSAGAAAADDTSPSCL